MRATLLLFLLLAGSPGCLLIPHPETIVGQSRRPLDPKVINDIRPAVSTRADVLLACGDPDMVSVRQRILIYHWRTSTLAWVMVIGNGLAGDDFPLDGYLIVKFDDHGIVREVNKRAFDIFHKLPSRDLDD